MLTPKQLRALACDVPMATDGTTATLLVSSSSSQCSHCRMSAFPHEVTHATVAGYGPQRRGCGARFTAIATPYRLDDDWRRAFTEMRPDLPIVSGARMPSGTEEANDSE